MLIYINGDTHEKAMYCWASNMDELNETAKIKLNLTKSIKFFFTQEGQIVIIINILKILNFKFNILVIL